MPSPSRTRESLVKWALSFVFTFLFSAQFGLVCAEEIPIIDALPGDQVFSHVSADANGGYVVWQDNITDKSGWGISARRLDSNLLGQSTNFPVNVQKSRDQEHPQVALLNNGSAAFVWQGGKLGSQNIYARFLSNNGTWITRDLIVNTSRKRGKISPVITGLSNAALVVWSSFEQDGSMQGIYAQRLSFKGAKLGVEFRVNQFTQYNQRTPAVTTLANGGFVVAWISEQQRFENSVDVYARVYNALGQPLGNEFCINTSSNVCASPALAAANDGSFSVAWGQKDKDVLTNSWDVWQASFDSAGTPAGSASRINTYTYGEQFDPKICWGGDRYLVVWTSLGQDGSREGVYGQYLNADSSPMGDEFRVNTTTVSQQIQPSLAYNGSQFIVVWSSFVAGTSFDLFATRLP